ncbi:MAG: hypothetical protein QHJ73_15895, partial [Armatimonadota bacterium]|nr:hypothetical protein [Armatimonadota bacterium]
MSDSLGFLSPAPKVTLVNAFQRPFDNAVAAARTCYSSTGIVTPQQVAGDDAPDEVSGDGGEGVLAAAEGERVAAAPLGAAEKGNRLPGGS